MEGDAVSKAQARPAVYIHLDAEGKVVKLALFGEHGDVVKGQRLRPLGGGDLRRRARHQAFARKGGGAFIPLHVQGKGKAPQREHGAEGGGIQQHGQQLFLLQKSVQERGNGCRAPANIPKKCRKTPHIRRADAGGKAERRTEYGTEVDDAVAAVQQMFACLRACSHASPA